MTGPTSAEPRRDAPRPTGRRRIVVTGASGNVGTGMLRVLAHTHPDADVVGVCRRPPAAGPPYDRVRWHTADLSEPDASVRLAQAFEGADSVVHLAWAIQPVDDVAYLHRANVEGTRAVLRAAAAAGVTRIVYSSSLGVYAPGATEAVTEDWPDSGQRSSAYSRHKVTVERMLDRFEIDHPEIAVARVRPTLVVQRDAAREMQALFVGKLVPRAALDALRRGLLPVFPLPTGLRLQFVHADDVGEAMATLLDNRITGSFNLAADELDVEGLAAVFKARPLEVSPEAFRAFVTAAHGARALPVTAGWYDVAINTPMMDTSRARDELAWKPVHSSTDSARELLDGLADGAAGPTPALSG